MSTPTAALVKLDPTALDLIATDRKATLLQALTDVSTLRLAIEARTIATQEDVHANNKDVQLARDTAARLDTMRKEITGPIRAQVDAINGLFNPVVKLLEATAKAGDDKFLAWQREEERKARIAREEHERQVREAAEAERKRREEVERARIEAEKAGANVSVLVPQADQVKDALAACGVTPEEVAAANLPPPPPAITGVRTEGYGGMGVTKRWAVEVVDRAAAAACYESAFDFKPGVALALIRARKDWRELDAKGEEFTADGLRFYKTASVSHR